MPSDAPSPPPFRAVLLDEVGSTNTEAFKRAAAGDAGPVWVVARRQTQGKGRSGRSWASDPGNLYASLMQRIACPAPLVYQISLVAGVAVLDAIRACAGPGQLPSLRLKWPNDVLIDAAKCVGILAESQNGAQAGEVVVVVGIGINLASHPDGIGRAATHLAAHDVKVEPPAMFAALAAAMARWIEVWDAGSGFAAIRTAWLARAGAPGEAMTVNAGAEKLSGAFVGLDEAGALLLRDASGHERRVTFGDVSLGGSGGNG